MKKMTIFNYLIVLILFIGCVIPTTKTTKKDKDDDDDDDDNNVTLTRSFNPTDNMVTGLTVDFLPAVGNTWTFMIYLDGDNNLDSYAITDFQEIVNGVLNANNANIKVLVLHDKYGTNNTILYNITPAGALQIGGVTEENMGDPATLNNFINYCTTNHPANHYALILWNHGDGARSIESDNQTYIAKNSSLKSKTFLSGIQMSKAICEDVTNGDLLYLDELRQAVSNNFGGANPKLDLIGFDACLMGTTEVAYEFRNLVNYMCGSMANVWVYGWNYNTLFTNMANDGSGTSDARELSKLIVKQFRDSTINTSLTQTMSAIDLSQMNNLKSAIDNFAIAIYNENKKPAIEITRDLAYHFFDNTTYDSVGIPYYDLSDFANQITYNTFGYSVNLVTQAQNVISALQNTVVCAYGGYLYGNYYGDGIIVKRGLSIFISRGEQLYNNESHYAYQWWYTSRDTVTDYGDPNFKYGLIDFCNSNNNGVVETWKELFEVWYDLNNIYTTAETW